MVLESTQLLTERVPEETWCCAVSAAVTLWTRKSTGTTTTRTVIELVHGLLQSLQLNAGLVRPPSQDRERSLYN
jgi:hypothetical protein